MTRLDQRAEWVTAGGFRALCAQAGERACVATLVQQRCVTPAGWWRVRIQGTPAGPARWMASWMPGTHWDAKYQDSAAADQSSFAWAGATEGAVTLTIHRRWGLWRPSPRAAVRDWGVVLPAFRQTVTTASGAMWEVAWGICHPAAWIGLPPPGTAEWFRWVVGEP
ncbi:MAG: hypothetical protein OWV35_07895 [Firmicutes bacterium]|nr:hypothetical protein [Bacillota bacterium]